MWCDNCLLLMPLRGGAIAWAVVIAAYSLAGGIFLLVDGQYMFSFYPEWQIYGGIGIGVAVSAILTMFALSNRSYIWIRVAKFLWPFIIVICAIRAIIMIVQLQRNQYNITWECNNGAVAGSQTTSTGSLPSTFCAAGFSSLNLAFIISLLVDLVFQIYMFFLTWRFSKRLEHYSDMKGPFHGGYYA